MERIKQAHLEGLVKCINEATGSPTETYTRGPDSQYTPNAMNYHLDWAYGGVCLVRMCKTGSAVTSISEGGFIPKRALYYWMRAFLDGFTEASIG